MRISRLGAGRLQRSALPLLVTLVGGLTMAPLAAAQTLQVYAGALAEPPEDLPLPLLELVLDPPFDDDIESYRLRVPHTVTGLSLVATSFFGVGGAEGESVDGSELSMQGWRFSRGTDEGAILSFDDLAAGDNTIRVGFGRAGSLDIYTIVVNRAGEVSSVALLTALGLSPGELVPPFVTDTAVYEASVPGGVIDVAIAATPWLGGRVALSGRSSEGEPLAVDGARVSGLTVGSNDITIGVTAEDGSTYAEYSVSVRRDAPSGSAVLHDLQFSEGPPEPGFLASAMSGVLPEGSTRPTPAFSPGVESYDLEVSEAQLTIRASAAAGSSFAVGGTTAGASALEIINQSSIGNANDHGAFLSVTLDGLAVGANAITLTVTDDSETVAPAVTNVIVTRVGGE